MPRLTQDRRPWWRPLVLQAGTTQVQGAPLSLARAAGGAVSQSATPGNGNPGSGSVSHWTLWPLRVSRRQQQRSPAGLALGRTTARHRWMRERRLASKKIERESKHLDVLRHSFVLRRKKC